MNKKVKRTCLWGIVTVVYIFLYLISFLHVPMSLFLRMLPPIVIIGLLTRGKPLWVKGVVSCTLVIAGVYTLFFNDILGPIGFMIRDMPIDMPAQFYHSWRYYWIVCYLYEVIWRWFWTGRLQTAGSIQPSTSRNRAPEGRICSCLRRNSRRFGYSEK